MTPADKLRRIEIGWIWAAVAFFVLVVVLGILSPVEAIKSLVVNQGVGDEEVNILAFIAGFTLPLTVGFGIIAFFVLTGLNQPYDAYKQAGAAGIILIVSGLLSQVFSVGLQPDLTPQPMPSMPLPFAILFFALRAYYTSYGLPLMISALAIGTAAALHVERWLHSALPDRPAPG
jgi:hypothetical protein